MQELTFIDKNDKELFTLQFSQEVANNFIRRTDIGMKDLWTFVLGIDDHPINCKDAKYIINAVICKQLIFSYEDRHGYTILAIYQFLDCYVLPFAIDEEYITGVMASLADECRLYFKYESDVYDIYINGPYVKSRMENKADDLLRRVYLDKLFSAQNYNLVIGDEIIVKFPFIYSSKTVITRMVYITIRELGKKLNIFNIGIEEYSLLERLYQPSLIYQSIKYYGQC